MASPAYRWAVVVLLAGSSCASAPEAGDPAPPPEPTLEEVWRIARDEFFDPDMNGADWPAALERYEPQAARARTPEELSRVINAMLGELKTSHTSHYPPSDPRYFELLDIFHSGSFAERIHEVLGEGEIVYTTLGLQTVVLEGEVFVYDVRDGLPAQAAGVRAGDRIVALDGAPYHASTVLHSAPGSALTLTVQRERGGPTLDLPVTPVVRNPGDVFLSSMRDSARVLERGGARVAYVRVRNYAGLQYQPLLTELLLDGPLAGADSLVLDIRGAWGGANPENLNLFNRRVPALTSILRSGEAITYEPQWRRPVVLLVDETARSGKEILAYGFRKYDLGPVVGATTAGAVVGGRPYLLSDGSLLFLAVQDARVDGERLEGIGVAPDIPVSRNLPYSQGVDPQYERALDVAADIANPLLRGPSAPDGQ